MKFSLRNNIVVLFLFMICNSSFAGNKDTLLSYFNDLKSRTLLVCLQTENEKFIEKLKSKGKVNEIDLYKKAIQLTNENFKKSVKLCWTINTDIKYIPVDSLEWFKSNFPTKYGYLALSSSQIFYKGCLNVGDDNVPKFSSQGVGIHVFLCNRIKSIAYCILPNDEVGQKIPKEEKENKVIYSDYYFSASKLAFVLYRINYLYIDLTHGISHFMNSSNGINSGVIKGEKAKEFYSKTLVARLQDCEKGFDLEKAKKYYPYEIKIVTEEEFENYLFSKDKNIVCFFVSSANANMSGSIFIQNAMNADDGLLATGFAVAFALNYKALEGFVNVLKKSESK